MRGQARGARGRGGASGTISAPQGAASGGTRARTAPDGPGRPPGVGSKNEAQHGSRDPSAWVGRPPEHPGRAPRLRRPDDPGRDRADRAGASTLSARSRPPARPPALRGRDPATRRPHPTHAGGRHSEHPGRSPSPQTGRPGRDRADRARASARSARSRPPARASPTRPGDRPGNPPDPHRREALGAPGALPEPADRPTRAGSGRPGAEGRPYGPITPARPRSAAATRRPGDPATRRPHPTHTGGRHSEHPGRSPSPQTGRPGRDRADRARRGARSARSRPCSDPGGIRGGGCRRPAPPRPGRPAPATACGSGAGRTATRSGWRGFPRRCAPTRPGTR